MQPRQTNSWAHWQLDSCPAAKERWNWDCPIKFGTVEGLHYFLSRMYGSSCLFKSWNPNLVPKNKVFAPKEIKYDLWICF